MQQAKESTGEHEERSKNITQTETQREKRVKRIEQSIQMLWDVISLNTSNGYARSRRKY